jgi:hypothetical protein
LLSPAASAFSRSVSLPVSNAHNQDAGAEHGVRVHLRKGEQLLACDKSGLRPAREDQKQANGEKNVLVVRLQDKLAAVLTHSRGLANRQE